MSEISSSRESMTGALRRPKPSRPALPGGLSLTVGARRPMSERLRKPLLTLHIVASVAWLGVEACLLGLAIVAALSDDPDRVRGIYIGMGALGAIFLPAFSFSALISGILISVGTKWGLLQYVWVVLKLVINVALTFGTLLLVNPDLQHLASQALAGAGEYNRPAHFIGPFTAGVVLLTIATVLSIYKPKAKTRFGRQLRP